MPSTETPELSTIATSDTSGTAAVTTAENIVNTSVLAPDTVSKKPEHKAEQKGEVKEESPEALAEAKEKAERAKVEAEKVSKREELRDLARLIAERRKANERIKAERSRLEQERQALLENERRYRDALSSAQQDPLKWLETTGVTPEDLAKRVVERGEEQTPEQKALRMAQEARDEASKLAKLLEADRQQAQEREAQRARETLQQKFLERAMNAETYPNMTTLWPSKEDVLEEVGRMSREAFEKGLAAGYTRQQMQAELNRVDDETCLSLLEKRATARMKLLEEKLSARLKKPVEEPKEDKVEKPAVKAKAAPVSTTNKTLTNKDSSSKSSEKVPLDRLTEREQNEILAAEYRRMRKTA
jgi:hypothetical protein